MLLRTALIGVLCAGCAHRSAESPPAPAAPAPVATTPSPAPPASRPDSASSSSTPVDFARDIKPILEARCQPCHFPGGRMYERLPFDRPETIRQLGPKLFTRITDESSQATIRAFLSQTP